MKDMLAVGPVTEEVSVAKPIKAQKIAIGETAKSHLMPVNAHIFRLKNLLVGLESVEIKPNKRANAKVSCTISYSMKFKKEIVIPPEIATMVLHRSKGATKAQSTFTREVQREIERGMAIQECAREIGKHVIQGVKVVFHPKQCLILEVGNTEAVTA
jgi:hypothetical protein